MNETINVLVSKKASVQNALESILKRAVRKGLSGMFVWSWGKAYACHAYVRNVDGYPPCHEAKLIDGNTWQIPVVRIPLTITGESPRFEGWRFIACLQHVDEANIVRVLPNEELPQQYRECSSNCDHCGIRRRRNDTYVLKHDDGRFMQVGSSCIKDFLGSNDALNLALRASLLSQVNTICEDESYGSSSRNDFLIEEFLPIVAWLVREVGWVSRTASKETGGTPTCDIAWELFRNAPASAKMGCEPTAEDIELAVAACNWVESLTETDITSDYMHNISTLVRTGLVSSRTIGLVASIIIAYQRHLGNIQLQLKESLSVHVGTVGDKVCFGMPAKVGKRGQVLKNTSKCVSEYPVTLERVAGYETAYGYTTVLTFRTREGACVVWKASSTEVSRSDVGKEFTLIGTIKEHGEYKGQKQTIMTRCTLANVEI